MSQISLKSISGITSITTPAGVDNQLTLHTNNSSQALKLDSAGNIHINNHVNVTGISSASNFKTGSSNLHSTGIEVSNINASGIVTASKFVGDGSDLTGVSGFSTALGNDTSSLLSHVFKTSVQHNIGAGTSVTIQSDAGSGNIAFTRLERINVATGATIRVAAGTTFIMNVLNVFS